MITWFVWGCNGIEAKAPLVVEDAIQFYQTQPSYLQPITPKETPDGLTSLSSESCGACHTEIYAEWAASTHAHAWSDVQFQAELKKPTKNGGNVYWMCVRCHTPYWDQLPNLVVDASNGLDFAQIISNPSFDSKLQADGVGCISCHLGDGVILGPTGDVDAPHPVKKAERLLTPEVCTNCHQAEAHFPEQNLACVFSTGKEHAESPQGRAGQSCQDCHMPEVKRPAAVGSPERVTRRHYFGGSLIPKSAEHAVGTSEMAPYYQHGLVVEAHLPTEERKQVEIRYGNQNAGHMLPTGDPERFLRIIISIENEAGASVYTEQIRIGSVYQWFPEVKLISDNRLSPEETRSHLIDVSKFKAGTYYLTVNAEKWRISEESLSYHELTSVLPSHYNFINLSKKFIISK